MKRRAYDLEDLALIFLTRRDGANAVELAERLGRTPSAIDWIWRTCEEFGGIGPRPSQRLTAQVEAVAARFGWAARMSCPTVAAALDRVRPSKQGAA